VISRLISTIFQGVSVFTALLFTFGYMYFGEFYGYFDLDPVTLDLPIWDYLVQGFGVLLQASADFLLRPFTAALWTILALLAFMAVELVLARICRISRWRDNLKARFRWIETTLRRLALQRRLGPKTTNVVRDVSFFVIAASMLLALGASEATKLANSSRNQRLLHPRSTIQLFFKEGQDKSIPAKIVDANRSDALVPLFQTKDLVVVIVKNDVPPSPYLLARSDLQAVRLVPQPTATEKRKSKR
jgi:hypothetical protein